MLTNLKHHKQGFTIVELLIVIVVIAILAAITIVAYNGLRQRARNADRQADINAIQKAVELYYAENGSYPKQGTVVGMDTEFPITTLGLPRDKIVNPSAPSGTTNSISESQTGDSMSNQSYGYKAWNNTTSCWSASDTCIRYTLYYKLEGETKARTVSGG